MIDYLAAMFLTENSKFEAFDDCMRMYGENYQWEAHEVVTSDGYKLNMFRILTE